MVGKTADRYRAAKTSFGAANSYSVSVFDVSFDLTLKSNVKELLKLIILKYLNIEF